MARQAADSVEVVPRREPSEVEPSGEQQHDPEASGPERMVELQVEQRLLRQAGYQPVGSRREGGMRDPGCGRIGRTEAARCEECKGQQGQEGRNERLPCDVESHIPESGLGAKVVEKNGEYCLFLSCHVGESVSIRPARSGLRRGGTGLPGRSGFAAAVILPADFHDPRLNDSKQMSARNRELLRVLIEREAVAWAVEAVSAGRIDEINILNASFEGMSLAVARLDPQPGFLAIDGNRFRTRLDIPYRCIVKGDGKYADIAAASVLAKTHRDAFMERLAEEFPQYGWASNKGYPTREHRLAIRRYGLTPYHRLSFNHEIDQLEFSF